MGQSRFPVLRGVGAALVLSNRKRSVTPRLPKCLAGIKIQILAGGTCLLVLLAMVPADGGGVSAQPQAWTELQSATSPSARAFHSMAYDAQSDRIVLFGGNERKPAGAFGSTGETWAYDYNNNRWTNMVPTAAPSPRDTHAVAYDEESDRVILFGGIGPVGGTEAFSNETWAYNWNANTWTNMQPPVSPRARLGARMAYAASVDRVILFGGHDASEQFADTWSYEFASTTWTELTPSSGPSARAFHTMAYDAESARIVLFGGQFFEAGTFVYFDDTWTYDGAANTWLETHPPSSPPERSAHASVYDSSSDRVLVSGGDPGGDDTWAYDVNANAWTKLDAPSGPSKRAGHAMAYDADSDRSVVFGGIWPYGIITDPSLERNSETWAFDLRAVRQIPPGPDPLWIGVAVAATGAAAAGAILFLRRRKRLRAKERKGA